MASSYLSLLSLFLLLESSRGFQSIARRRSTSLQCPSSSAPALAPLYYNLRDADMMELMVGGERYEMVPLPDSMMDTTLFVGNLCEFCKDEDLSNLFQAVSQLHSVPACVARKPNYTSLRYGFVTFLTKQEKEAAIMRFHGVDFLGHTLKVEPIRDHPKMGRVKVPERMVSYVVGAAKKPNTSSSNVNSLRSIARVDQKEADAAIREQRKHKQQEEKKKLESQLEFPLNSAHQDELLRAARRGYLVLEGRGSSRGRKTNALACAHRQYCDERNVPQIVLCKATGAGGKRSPLDCLVVDLSPLRLMGAVGDELVDDFMIKWKTQILTAAANAGMALRRDYREDNCQSLSIMEDEEEEANNVDDDECGFDDDDETEMESDLDTDDVETSLEYTITFTDQDSWVKEPISRLPVLSLGVFEGERIKAKAMAKELADLWGIPTEPLDEDSLVEVPIDTRKADSSNSNKRRGNKDKRYRRNENRRKRRNDQRDLDMFFR